MSLLATGQTLKHYKIKRKLGQGGMGAVYLAEDAKLGRLVAIKILPVEATWDEKAKLRLLQEARSASQLNHPNIVTIYSIDEFDEADFIVMEYVAGETLRAVVERQPLALPQLLDTGAQMADALAAAHARGIIHRDIKSENVLLAPNWQPKILDFGLAKTIEPICEMDAAEAPTKFDLTGAGAVVGTLYYMSPEQTRGETLDARSDIFSLGCVLYEAATGKLPFAGKSLLAIAHDIATAEPAPPSRLRPDLPVEFDIIIERALAKDRERRYNSAAELAAGLKSLRGISAAEIFTASHNGASAEISNAKTAAPESFVGRESEFEKLEELTAQMIGGAGRVAFVTGEPGIGKSSLIREFLRRARVRYTNIMTLQGRSVEQYGTGEAYLPFLEAIGALLATAHRERIVGLLRTYAPTWCLQFPAAFVSSVALEKLQQETAGATKERMMREMGDLLAALAAHTPVVLLLEDLHWADPSSVDLLRHLGQRIADQRILIVGTYRPEDLERSGEHALKTCKLEMQTHKLCEEFALGSLGEAHIAGFLDAHFRPNNFPSALSALIYGKTEGHPLFAVSLIQFLTENGDIAEVCERWTLKRPLHEIRLEVPENVRSLIRKKIEALDEHDRRALQYASVEGEEFLSTVLAALLDCEEIELEERLAVIERVHNLIETIGEEELPDGNLATRYRFAHALYQNVLYADLVSKRRVLLHRNAGEKLVEHYGRQSSRIAAQLATHFERGRDFARAAEYLVHAGDRAAGLFANAVAAEHYSRALKLSKEHPTAENQIVLTLYQKRGKANLALGKFQNAVDDFTEMLEAARRAGATNEESAALNALTMTLFYSHRLDEITRRADEILHAAERAGSEALRIEAMQVLALKHLGDGELDRAKLMLDEIITGARALNHKSVLLAGLAWRGILHFFQTEYETAETMLTEAQTLAKELRDSFLLLETFFVLGMVRGNCGRMSEALETFEEGIEMSARYEDQFWGPRMPNCIGWIYRELQDFERALEYDQKGLNVGRQANVLEAQANSLINLGITETQRSEQRGRTLAAFREVESIFERDAWFRWRYKIRLHAGKSEHALAEKDFEKAESHARRLLEAATHYEARKYSIVAHNLLAQITLARKDFAQAETELTAALALLEKYPVPIVAWKVYANVGNLRLQIGDAARAREAFAKAADMINQIAANVTDENLRATFVNSSAVKNVLAAV